MKDILGYEGLYKISDNGLVISYEKKWITGRGKGRLCTMPPKDIVPFITPFGYKRITLWKGGVQKKYFIHRLVALAYCSGFRENLQVNHIDGNKLNNHYSNLEWVSSSENLSHAFRTGLKVITEKTKRAVSKRHSGGRNNKAKAVIDLDTGVYYDTIKEAATAKGLSFWNLHAYLQGRNKNKTALRYA